MKLIPGDVGELKTLRQLEILNFNYQEFPKWILKLPNLEQLIFRGHDVENLPCYDTYIKRYKQFLELLW